MAINDKSKILIDESLEENSGDDDEEEVNDEHQKPLIDSESGQTESVIPLSIGKIKIFKPRRRKRFLLKKYFKLCSALLVIIVITVYLLRLRDSLYLSSNSLMSSKGSCDRLETTSVWNQTFPMLTIESALRLVDINNDTILDVIVPFGTGLDASYYNYISCQIYFNQTKTDTSGCGGGVMAIDGRSGQQLWVRYTPHELFASNCNHDINGDSIKDCILGGRMATLYAIDGSTGAIIWSIAPNFGEPIVETSNFYTPLYIPRDVDKDGVPDLVVIHGGDPLRKPNERTRLAGRLLIMSAKTGTIISWSLVPDKSESYYSPQLLVHPDSTLLILYGTGGETHAGALYAIAFDDLLNKRIERSRVIYKDCCKGVMVPPALIDINDDDVLDIVMSLFNSTVIAFDGLEFKELWRAEFPTSETYSTPAVGFFNNDTTPDFVVLNNFGPGFPVYYSAQLSVLDGRNGKQLLEKPIDMLIGTQSSPLTISTTTTRDLFLFWYSSCDSQENDVINASNAQTFQIAPGTTIHDNSRADFCKLRFNDTLFTQLRALSPKNMSIIYDSRDHKNLNKINYTAIGYKWIEQNMAPNNIYDTKPQEPDTEQQFAYQPLYQEYQYKRQPYSDNSYDQNYDSRPVSYDRIFKSRRRYRRHVGIHDGGGIQRVISTGTLAPPLSGDKGTIDLIYGTFWFPASKNVKLLTQEMSDCISRFMDPREESRQRLESDDTYFKRMGFDHDAYEESVKNMCTNLYDKRTTISSPADSLANNLVKEMGEMTLYRVNLRCVSDQKYGKVGAIKEFDSQWWPSYMGKDADSVVNVNDVSVDPKQ